MRKIGLCFCVTFFSMTLFGQVINKRDTVVRVVGIKHELKGNELLLSPVSPELQPIAGAPNPFFTYYWEFGDGKYSKKKKPTHIYKNKGDYEVKLWVTNHYDTGKTPTTRPKKVSVNSILKKADDVALMSDDFMLQKNREPIPNEEIVLVMRYKNSNNYVSNGKIFIFYNEKKYTSNNFELTDIRTHHNEKQIADFDPIVYAKPINDNAKLYASLKDTSVLKLFSLQDSTKTDLRKTIEESKNYYKNKAILEFDDLLPEEERNIFLTMKTTPEMLKDTSAIISIRGVYVPDSNYKNHKVKELEMEIVTSHDPNKMSSNGTFMNYRLVRFKTLKYKIQFQNNGEGPAKRIRLETDIPEMLNKATLKIVDMYPECPICPKEEVSYSCLDTTFTAKQAVFTFKNIYLPGSEQKGVEERDSTKGFVKYSIKFAKDFHKKKTRSRTSIIFDKNDPIITNYSTTRFLPGISIGAKAGYNYFTKLEDSKSYFLGFTVSPFKSYRWYWQAEFLNDFHSYKANTTIYEEDEGGQDLRRLKRTTETNSFKNVVWEVPVLAKYNVNNYIGLGVGLQGKITMSQKRTNLKVIENFEARDNQELKLIDKEEVATFQTKSFENFKAGLLFEVTGGFARIGPSLGARYIVNSDKGFDYFQFYAIWKF